MHPPAAAEYLVLLVATTGVSAAHGHEFTFNASRRTTTSIPDGVCTANVPTSEELQSFTPLLPTSPDDALVRRCPASRGGQVRCHAPVTAAQCWGMRIMIQNQDDKWSTPKCVDADVGRDRFAGSRAAIDHDDMSGVCCGALDEAGPAQLPLPRVLKLFHPIPFTPPCYPLSGQAFARSLAARGDAQLHRAIARIRTSTPDKPFVVLVIGGSVAQGYYPLSMIRKFQTSVPTSHLFLEWLMHRYNKTAQEVQYVNIAKAATNSMWRNTNMKEVMDRINTGVDLLFYDYTSNDLYGTTENANHLIDESAAATETVLRAVLGRPHPPAIMMLGLARSLISQTYEYHERLLRLAQHYNFTFVNYIDAIRARNFRQSMPKKPNIFELVETTVHPIQSVLQLITDTLVFAWTSAEGTLHHKLFQPQLQPQTQLPPPIETETLMTKAIQRCHDDGYTSHIDGSNGVEEFQPISVGTGWHFIDTPHKEGWQYDTPDGLPLKNGTVGPAITFNIEVGEDAVVIFHYLRSYERFGQALVWLDNQRDQALNVLQTNDKFRQACNHALQGNMLKMRYHGHLMSHECMEFFEGQPLDSDPVLEGRWSDHSSMTYPAAFWGSNHLFRQDDVNVYRPDPQKLLTTPGKHTISIAMLGPRPWYGIHPYLEQKPTSIKILGLSAC